MDRLCQRPAARPHADERLCAQHRSVVRISRQSDDRMLCQRMLGISDWIHAANPIEPSLSTPWISNERVTVAGLPLVRQAGKYSNPWIAWDEVASWEPRMRFHPTQSMDSSILWGFAREAIRPREPGR